MQMCTAALRRAIDVGLIAGFILLSNKNVMFSVACWKFWKHAQCEMLALSDFANFPHGYDRPSRLRGLSLPPYKLSKQAVGASLEWRP